VREIAKRDAERDAKLQHISEQFESVQNQIAGIGDQMYNAAKQRSGSNAEKCALVTRITQQFVARVKATDTSGMSQSGLDEMSEIGLLLFKAESVCKTYDEASEDDRTDNYRQHEATFSGLVDELSASAQGLGITLQNLQMDMGKAVCADLNAMLKTQSQISNTTLQEIKDRLQELGSGTARPSSTSLPNWWLPPEKFKQTKMELGRGSFGTVFKGKLFGKTRVAIKVIAIINTHVREAFEKEIRIMFRLHHPNIVRCFGWVPVRALSVFPLIAICIRLHAHTFDTHRRHYNFRYACF